jgi:hypothetical protein
MRSRRPPRRQKWRRSLGRRAGRGLREVLLPVTTSPTCRQHAPKPAAPDNVYHSVRLLLVSSLASSSTMHPLQILFLFITFNE